MDQFICHDNHIKLLLEQDDEKLDSIYTTFIEKL